MESDNGLAMRGICASYFETHVSPVLKLMGRSQEQMNTQLQELRTAVAEKKAPATGSGGSFASKELEEIRAVLDQKADVTEVPSIRQFEAFVAKADLRGSVSSSGRQSIDMEHTASGASAVLRMTRLADEVSRKADASAITKLTTMIEQKVSAKDVAALTQDDMDSLRRAITDIREDIKKCKNTLVLSSTKSTLGSINGGTGDLSDVSPDKRGSTNFADKAEMKKIQLVVAAAGARFDKQIRELRQQVRDLSSRSEVAETGSPKMRPQATLESRWPGRSLKSPVRSEAGSAAGESDIGSIAPSMVGSTLSTSGLSPEERAEFKKIQAVVGAAGTAFTKELRDVRGQLRELQNGLRSVRERIGDNVR